MTATLAPAQTETLPQEDQAPAEEEGAHWVCRHCFPDPQFGEIVTTCCGRKELFDEWKEDAPLDCHECLKVGYDPCFMCGR